MWSIYNYIRICHCFPRDKKVFKREPLMTINWPPSCAPVYSKYIFSVNQSAYVGPMYVMPILLPSGNEIVWVLDRYKKAEVIEFKIVDGSLINGYGIENSCRRIKHLNVICLVISLQLTYDDPSFWTWGFIHERPSWVSWARVLVLPVLELDLRSEHFRVIELCIGDR